MSVSNVSISTPAAGTAVQGSSQASAMRTAFQQLTAAIGSGDLKSAQSAYATITGLQQSSGQTQGEPDGPFAQLMSSLGKDLQSGDLTTAKTDLASFQQAHGKHHHHGGGHAAAAPSDGATTTTAAGAAATSTNAVDVSV